MVSLLSRGVGLFAKSLSGISCTQAIRCSSLSSAVSVVQSVTSRWFSKHPTPEIPTLDDLPKRPMGAFFRFMKEMRPILLKRHPGASPQEICSFQGKEWRNLPADKKQVYIDAARADLLKYRETVQEYKENFDLHQLNILKGKKKQERERRMKKRAKTVRRKESALYGKPKGNRRAFNIFVSEHYHDSKSALSVKERLIQMMEEWKKLPMTHKQRYTQLAEDDKVRYENEIKVWEKQMIEIGRLDLLRKGSKVHLLRKKMEEATGRQKDFKSVTGKEKSPRKHEE